MTSSSSEFRGTRARIVRAAFLVIMIAGLVSAGAISAEVPEQLVRLVAAKQPGTTPVPLRAAPTFIVPQWGTGICDSLLPGGFGGVPGSVDTAWLSLQQQAVDQVEAMYGQNDSTDPSHTTALVKARGITRALMFATLVKAINDVSSGTATGDEATWVAGFQGVVKRGRQWMAFDAINRYNAYINSTAFQATVANNIAQLFFGLIGLPWRNDPYVPSARDLLNDAETALWGPPATTNDGPAGDLQNYPLGTAESADAMEQMTAALSFLNAIGHTQIVAPGGTDATLSVVMANIENAVGSVSGGELAEGIVQTAELGNILASGEGGMSHAGVFIALVNSLWTLSDALLAADQLATVQSNAFGTPDLKGALGDADQFSELLNDFVAITLHSEPNAGATGNDPDCRTVNKPAAASPPGADATFTVSHFNTIAPASADYSYTTQVLGGNAPGTIGVTTPPANTVNDPSVLDWSFSRDVGPGAPRIGTNWPISEISYGVPGDPPDGSYDLAAASLYYPENGSWYITFNGADGTPYTTNFLYIYHDGSGIHPTDSEVAKAIVNADPNDFPCNPSSGSQNDPALNPADKGNWPCLDWNPTTHLGTMLVVRGDQPDNNGQAIADYQVIFDILVKGDLGGWSPVFVGHGGQGPGDPSVCTISGPSSVGGVCVGVLGGIPLGGDVVQSKVLWSQQQNDICVNDPHTCAQVPSYGWPTPYPVARECQSVSPAGGMFVINYVGQVNSGNPTGSCNNLPNAGSWTLTPSIRYRAANGSLWTAWRVPPTIGTSNFLNIQMAQFLGGETAGIVLFPAGSNHNAFQLVGTGTHWTTEFHSGDNIMVVDPTSGQNNGLGGLVSIIRKVDVVLDDTDLNLSSSVECVSGTDGNDCDMFSTVGYTSFMNSADGTDGGATGMYVNCTSDQCVIPAQTYPFNVYKLTVLNPGTTCPTWDPTTQATPPSSGCYYSNSIQFQAQTGANDGQSRWWNASLPAPPAAPALRQNADAPTSALEPWLDQPMITLQPQSVLVNVGANVSFTTAVTGTPTPTVQWQQSTNSGTTWGNIPAATGTTYSVNGVTQGQNGTAYRAIFTNANGSRTTHSATLGINAAPQITLSPASVAAAQPGDLITLTGTAYGAPAPAATWQLSTDNGATWNNLGGATSTLSLIAPPTGARLLVQVVYTNASGSATSDIAVVTTDRVFQNGFELPPAFGP